MSPKVVKYTHWPDHVNLRCCLRLDPHVGEPCVPTEGPKGAEQKRRAGSMLKGKGEREGRMVSLDVERTCSRQGLSSLLQLVHHQQMEEVGRWDEP